MGNSRWDPGVYRSYSASVKSKSQQQIFTNTSGCHDDLNPAKFDYRESCDSAANPKSTPIIIGVDETGSMGHLATEIIKQGLGVIVEGIYDRKPVSDPHILLAALGDANCDAAPIQATQFEADTRIVQQIEKFFIESNGGGNGGESYSLAWWLALHKTKCDAIDKRNARGYLFTIGDEWVHDRLNRGQIHRFLGAGDATDAATQELLEEVSLKWNVFHLITPTGSTSVQEAIPKWRQLLGERAVVVEDHKKLGEVIVSIMQVNEGHAGDEVADSWDADSRAVVRNAVAGLLSNRSGRKEIVAI